jgi:hypothetical protein
VAIDQEMSGTFKCAMIHNSNSTMTTGPFMVIDEYKLHVKEGVN